MAESNLPNVDALFKEEFDQIEVRFNPSHWQQLQDALHQTAVELDEPKAKTNPAKLSLKMILFAVLAIIGILVLVYLLKQNSEFVKPQFRKEPAVQPIKSGSENNTGKDITTPLPQNHSQEIQADPTIQAIESVSPSDTLPKKRKARIITDTLKKDTISNPLDNFIFW